MRGARSRRPRRGLGFLIAWNSGVQVVGLLLASAISLFTFAAITRHLGPTTFGHYAAALAFLSIPVILGDAGLSTQVLRDISREPGSTESAMGASLPLRLETSTVIIATAAALAAVLPLHPETRAAIQIGAVGAFLNLLSLALLPVLQAQLRMGWAVIGNVGGRALTLGLTLAAIALDMGLRGVLWAYAAGWGGTLAIELVAVTRLIRLRPVLDGGYWARLLRGYASLGIGQAVGQLYYRVGTVLLAMLRPARDVGLYAVAFKFVELAAVVVSALMNSVFAPLARYTASDERRLRALVQRVFVVLLFIALPMTILAAVFARDLVVLVGGPGFADAALALQILAPYPVISFMNVFIERAIIAAGRDGLLLAWNTGFIALSIVLHIALISALGFVGAAVAAIGVEVAALAVGVPIFRSLFGFLPELRAAAPILAAGAAMALVTLAVPGPPALVAAAALTLYAAGLLAAPGGVRGLAGDLLTSARRTQAAA